MLQRQGERGYAALGLYMPKNELNVGGVIRAAQCFGATLVVVHGRRYWSQSTDTMKSWRHIPVVHSVAPGELLNLVPFGCVPVAVELTEGAIDLPSFVHPERAFYIFGPEEGSVPKHILDSVPFRVQVPMAHPDACMNLAASANVVLYDRMMKRAKSEKRGVMG